jgi:hypothetical protein
MKVNVFLTLICVLLALLLGYWAFNIAKGQENDKICGICSVVCFAGTLIPMIGLKHESSRIDANIRVLSLVFFILFAISHFCFANFGVRMPYYVIVNSIALLVYIAIAYSLSKAKV